MSPGFKHDPLADISELMQVLRDQYDAASIPKELIQNADDASAKSLHLTWAAGWPDNPYPLLRAPALVVLNDGVFRDQDAEAIQYLRLGAKGSDSGTIGKFGLGLKSVFHLSEAFLYFASASQPTSRGTSFRSWLNPWHGSKLHRDWSGIEDEFDVVQAWLEQWQHGHDQWFALWLPLRQRGQRPYIVEEFPQPKDFFSDALAREITRAFPLLRRVERVCVWSGGEHPVLDYSVSLNADADRRLFPDIALGQSHQVSGRISVHRKDAVFVGHELLVDDPVFVRLQDDESWPQTATIDETTGEAALVRDKALPHAAAVFVASDAAQTGRGSLRIAPAVFLPLAEDFDKRPCGKLYDYELLLHGNYFVDAGRRHLAADNAWNADQMAR